MAYLEHALIFAKAGPEKLAFAERLVVALPGLSRRTLVSCDLAWRSSSRFLAALARFTDALDPAALRDRLAFWTARSGGRAMPLPAPAAPEVAAFRSQLEVCDVVVKGLVPENLADGAARVFAEAGASPTRRRATSDELLLALDVGGPGWAGVSFRPDEDVLFLPGPLAPPVGDELALSFRLPGAERPVAARGIVLEVRRPERALAGQPAGYAVGLWDPPDALRAALAAHAPASAEPERAAPRFRMKAPVRVVAAAPALAPAPPAPRALVEYATEQELAADWIENLSQGGAFVRTAHPAPVGTPVALELKLPNGAELHAQATVASVAEGGMGVRFTLDPEGEATLAAAISHIAGRPRRALVVDDDALVRRMLADALQARGFEVLAAEDATRGLHTLAEEVLALDLLVTDVAMPGMDGETFVRTIRQAGGEADLAIVVATGRLDGDLEPRLAAAGADAVVEKALGPELVAAAADAALERKRAAAIG